MSKGGRPSIFTQELADDICAALSEGKSLRSVCRGLHMPSAATVFMWLRTNSGFLEQYTRAKEESADALAEEMLYIANTPKKGKIVTKKIVDGEVEVTTREEDMLGHRRLQVDTYKFMMAKMKPKKYGEKLDITGGLKNETRHRYDDMTDEQLVEEISKRQKEMINKVDDGSESKE